VDNNLHRTEDQLEQYALGRLPSSDLLPLEEHLIICTVCQEHLSELENFIVGTREALRRAPEPDSSSVPRTDWFGWLRRPAFQLALGFAAVILVVAVYSNGRTNFVPSASLQLTAMRGEMPFTVPAQQFDITLADAPRNDGSFHVEVVNATGDSIWAGAAENGPGGVRVHLSQRLMPGDYFVRLFSASGAMLHEYGFRIRN
jgi:anti-sigma factor RsiW